MARSAGRRQCCSGGTCPVACSAGWRQYWRGGGALWRVARAGVLRMPLGDNVGEEGRALWRVARAGVLIMAMQVD